MVLVETPKSRLASVIVILLEEGLEESVTSRCSYDDDTACHLMPSSALGIMVAVSILEVKGLCTNLSNPQPGS
tara:strand:- start:139 stop:357 length:219 start_codon:yes stop_codon:yes gene_type:complete